MEAMEASDHAAPGDVIAPSDLTLHMARQLCRVACSAAFAYASFVEARRLPTGEEIVVCEVEVEVPQRPVHDIRRHERVAVLVSPNDADTPLPLALRRDFPAVPHTYPVIAGSLVPLCLYEQPWSEVRLDWTPTGYLHQLRDWLARTARGELHGDDQPLEPLLLAAAPTLIVPHDLAPIQGDMPEHLLIHARDGGNGRCVYVAERPEAVTTSDRRVTCAAVVIGGRPQPHGVIRQTPRTLDELHLFLQAADVDLRAQLGCILKAWRSDRQQLELSLMLIVILPKTRRVAGDIEEEELRAFYTRRTIGEIGEALGLWQMRDGHAGLLLGAGAEPTGVDVPLELLNPTRLLSRDRAARLNGRPDAVATRIMAVGLGALGSQVFMNLVRAGYGEWTLVDDDQLLPHNLARHALDGWSLGGAKAAMLAAAANATIAGGPIATPLVANILNPGEQAEAVRDALTTAEVVVDMSAALGGARYLARDIPNVARRLSLFLNPAGADLVLLAEDAGPDRRTPLDWAEMMYYRHLLHEDALARHHDGLAGHIRYGGGCRDVSGVISQERVALLAAIASRGLRAALNAREATIAVWRSDEDGAVVATRARPTPIVTQMFGEWTLCTDTWVRDRMTRTRAATLPNETGGVLVGVHDMRRRIVYIVDILESPPDSVEWPTLYIRGCRGLPERLRTVAERTGGMVRYVGEWHSHPHGCSPAPSDPDRAAFAWLAEWMGLDDCPAVMAIVADTPAWYLGTMP